MNKAPWPVRKGVYRSTGQSDFVQSAAPPSVRSPSPVIEIPETPAPSEASHYSTPVSSPIFNFEKAKSPPLVVLRTAIREIPIELCEVNYII